MITEWWTSLDLFMKILWCIAIATSLTFIIQSILTFVGIDSDTDLGGDIDPDFGGGLDMHPDFDEPVHFQELGEFLSRVQLDGHTDAWQVRF